MGGGNLPKPPPSSSSAHTHHRNSGWGSSSASADKPSATIKSKPSPSSATATTPNNKDTKNNPPPAKPRPRPENPSPRPENPNAVHGPRPVFPINDPLPAPSYGVHMLDRRSILLADGSVRSYFALPPDYENHALAHMHRPGLRPEFMGRREFGLERPPLPMSPGFVGPDARVRNPEYWASGHDNPLKRKLGEDERGGRDDGYERVRQQLLQYGNANGAGPSTGYNIGGGEEIRVSKNMRVLDGSSSKLKHGEVDQNALKKAFLHFVKLVFESGNQRKNYLADGKQGPVPCLACGRSSKDFPHTHSLIMHAYSSENEATLVDHSAFHKALCILMGWNYTIPPDNSRDYQKLSPNQAEANRDDLIFWPPTVLIRNTITGKGRDGRLEGIGNKAMDSILRGIKHSSIVYPSFMVVCEWHFRAGGCLSVCGCISDAILCASIAFSDAIGISMTLPY
ncbi:large proline-rich protein bag6-B [Striga asiatica]|uniref:Large proline-rich protein bag6-B n=1 Tax=Striga asiatica TaxID=4170 RepID=A0A5A7QHW9_STRAF|nr:large proline-rich protein bag6-B [Striga asiatica]